MSPSSSCLWVFVCGSAGAFALGVLLLWSGSDSGSGAAELLSTTFLSTSLSNTAAAVHTWLDHSIYQHQHQRQHQHQHRHQGSESSSRCDLDVNAGLDAERSHHMVQEMWPLESTGIMEELNKSKESDLQEQHHDQEQQSRNATASSRAWAWLNALASRGNSKPINNIETSHSSDDAHGHGHAHHGHNHVHGHAPNAGSASVPGSEPESEFHSGFHHDGHTHIDIDVGSVSWFDAGSRSRLGSGGESSAFSALEPELSLSSLPYEGDVEFHAHDHDEHELWPTMFHILDQIDEQEQRFMALQATGGAQPTEAPGQQSTVSSAGPTAPPLSPLPVPLVSCVRSVVQEWDDHVECVVTLDRVPVSRNTYVTLTSDPTQGLFSPNVVVYVPGQGNTTINGTGNTSHSNNTTPLTLATVNATSTPTSTSSSSQSNQLSNTITLGFTEDNYATPQIITVYGLTQYSETPSSSSWCMSSLVSTDTGHSRSVDCIANSSLITSHYAFPSITSISPTIVPLTGANVTLTGTNLDHVVVFMGNILVGISQQNDTHVIFRAPPSPTQANATWNNMYQSITVAVPDQTGKGAIPFDFFHSYIEPMNNDTDTGTPTPQIPSWPTNATLGGCLFCPGVPPESETVNGLTPETSSRYELLRSANNVARQSASLPCPFVLAGASGNSGQSRCAPAAQTLYYLKTSCAEGEYSTPDGDTCLPCPSDRAICPGGPRMWPKPGYWTYSESALQVQECLPPSLDRCPVGGRLSPCGGAYNQPICSYCQPNFYWDTGSCRPCDAFNSVEAALVVTVTSLFFIILGTFVTYLSDTHLEWMVVAVVSGQQVIQVGRSVSQYMSPTFALVYNFMKIFCFDYQFVRPGCVEHEVKFVNLYWGALVYLVFVYAFFMVCALVYQWRHGAPGENWIKNPSQPRMVRAIISAYHIVYMQMVMYTLQIINCVRDDLSPDLVLVAETSQVCFDHLHKPVYIVALIVLLLYCIGVPLFFVGVLAKFRSQHSTRRFQRKWGFLFSEFHPTFYWWSLCDYTGSFFMALQLTLIRFNALLIITTSTSLFVFDVIITAAFRPFHVRYKNHAAFVIGTGKIFSCAILFFLRGNVAPGVIVLVACVALVVLSFFLVRRIRGKDKAKNLANANTQQLLTMRMGKDGDQHRDEMHGFGAGKLPNSNYVYGQGKSGLGLSLGGGLNPLPIAAVNLNEMDVRCIHDLSADMPLGFDYAAYQDANIRFTYSNQEDQPGDGPHLSDLANHSTRAGPKADHAIEHDELSTFEQPPLNAWTEQASQQAGQQHHRRSHSHSRRHSHSGSHRHIRSHSHSRATNRPRTASVQVHADALRRMSGPAAVRLDPIPKSERPRSHSHGKPESQSDSRSRSRSLSLQPHSGYLSHDQRAAAPVPAFSRHSISSSEPESFQLERAAIAEAAYQDQSRLARYGSPVTLIHSAESADPSPPPAGASAPVRVRALTFSLSSLEQAILQDVDSYRYIPGDEGVVCIPGDATHDDASASASVYT